MKMNKVINAAIVFMCLIGGCAAEKARDYHSPEHYEHMSLGPILPTPCDPNIDDDLKEELNYRLYRYKILIVYDREKNTCHNVLAHVSVPYPSYYGNHPKRACDDKYYPLIKIEQPHHIHLSVYATFTPVSEKDAGPCLLIKTTPYEFAGKAKGHREEFIESMASSQSCDPHIPDALKMEVRRELEEEAVLTVYNSENQYCYKVLAKTNFAGDSDPQDELCPESYFPLVDISFEYIIFLQRDMFQDVGGGNNTCLFWKQQSYDAFVEIENS